MSLRLTTRAAFNLIYMHVAGAFADDRTPGNVCLHGTYGVGKSAGAAGLCSKLSTCKELEGKFNGKVHLLDVRAGSMQAADIQGIPYTAENGEFRKVEIEKTDGSGIEDKFIPLKDMMFSTPMFWPADADDDDGRPMSEKPIYIMFLDELKNAKNAEQHAIYRVLQERTCQNGKKLGANVFIMAAGNINSDKTGSRELLPAAANRFEMHIEIDAESKKAAEDFCYQASEDGIDESIQAYLLSNPNQLAPVCDGNCIPRPRTWYGVNNHLRNVFLSSDEDDLSNAIRGCIGDGATTSFMAFRELRHMLPDFEKVAEGQKYEKPDAGNNYTDLSFYIAMVTANFIGDEAIKWSEATGEDRDKITERIANVVKMLIGEEMGVETTRNGKRVLDVGNDGIITADATVAMIRTWKNSDRFRRVLGSLTKQITPTARLMKVVLTKM